MPRSPPPRADTNQKTRTRKDGENNPPEDQCPLEDSQKLHSAVATYNPFSLPPLSRPASPLSENLRRYEKYGLAVIGPQSSSNTAAASFTTGATNTRISRAFYFPNGAVSMSGGATLHDTVDTSACLMLVGSQVTLANGSAAGTTCTGLGGSGSATAVVLVQ